MNRFFEKEFIKGKGMKNAGIGGLIVGNHYKIKQENADQEQDKKKYSKWLSNYNKKVHADAKERNRQEQLEIQRKIAEKRVKLNLQFKKAAAKRKNGEPLESGDLNS